jgi:hypothetical protein
VGDSANWEFAALVAAVTIGLGGLLAFTLLALVGGWRMFSAAYEAAREAAETSASIREVANRVPTTSQIRREPDERELADVRRGLERLAEEQSSLRETLRALAVSADRGDNEQRLRDVESAVRRLEETVSEIAVAIGDINQRIR